MIRCTRVWTRAFARRCLLLLLVILLPGVAKAQVDYSAGKSPEQLFNSDCSACHTSPQAVGRGRDVRALTVFLGQHYTTKTQWAALLANYLVRARDMPPPAPPAPARATGETEQRTRREERPREPQKQAAQLCDGG